MVLKKTRGYLFIKSIEYLDKIAINGHYIRENVRPLVWPFEGCSRVTPTAIYLGVGSLSKKSDVCSQNP